MKFEEGEIVVFTGESREYPQRRDSTYNRTAGFLGNGMRYRVKHDLSKNNTISYSYICGGYSNDDINIDGIIFYLEAEVGTERRSDIYSLTAGGFILYGEHFISLQEEREKEIDQLL